MNQSMRMRTLSIIILSCIVGITIIYIFVGRLERRARRYFSDRRVQALIVAAHKKDEVEIERLIADGVDPSIQGMYDTTPLGFLMRYEDLAAFEMLLKHGADPQRSKYKGRSVLRLLCRNPDIRYLKACLENGLDPNSLVSSPDTMLHETIMYPEKVSILLTYGADPNIKGKFGATPLFTAVNLNQYCTAMTLLEHGADPTILDDAKWSLPEKIKKNTSVPAYNRESDGYQCALELLDILSKPPYSSGP